MKLHNKLMIACFVTIIIPIAALSYIFISQSTKLMLTNIGDSYHKLLTQVNSSIHFNIMFYESLTDNIMLSPIIQTALENPEEYADKGIYMMNKEIGDSIRYINAYRAAEIKSIRFFSFLENSISDGQYWFPIDRLTSSVPESALTDSKEWLLDESRDKDQYVYKLIRPIFSIRDFRKIGYMQLDLNIESIIAFGDQKSSVEDQMFIINKEGTYLFHSTSNLIGQSVPPDIKKSVANKVPSDQVQIKVLDNIRYFIWFEAIPEKEWISVLLVPENSIDGKINKSRNYWIIFSALGAFIFTVLSYVFIRRLTLGLRRLHNKVSRLGTELFYPKVSVKRRYDEVSELDHNFDEMMMRFNRVIQENFIKKLEKKELELNLLQSQINPHFLYNTLESIKNEIDLDEKETAIQMVVALADLFRVSLSKGKNFIVWREEIYHAKCYLLIHQIRFGVKYEIEWDMDVELDQLYTLKIILQPLLENAILHGFKHIKQGGKLYISGKRFEHTLKITVKDNGVGIMKSDLIAIEKQIKYGNKGGVGLTNINQRIKVYFGDAYGLTLHSEVGAGTEAVMILPVLEGDPNV